MGCASSTTTQNDDGETELQSQPETKPTRRQSSAIDSKPHVVLSAEEKMKVKEAFEKIDNDNNGFLDREELRASLVAMGHPDPSDATIQIMLEAVSMPNAQEINLEEFEIIWKHKDSSWDWGTQVSNWFSSLVESVGTFETTEEPAAVEPVAEEEAGKEIVVDAPPTAV